MTFATPGWVTTLFIFILFAVGGYFAYGHISERQRIADYEACVERIAMVSRTATEYSLSVAACDYLREGEVRLRGRYSSIAGAPQTLAMTKRPIF